jgi:hypothetical protein
MTAVILCCSPSMSRGAVDAQRLVNSWGHKEQANGWVLKQILQRMQPPDRGWPGGAGRGHGQNPAIPARTDVHAALGMNGADHHE